MAVIDPHYFSLDGLILATYAHGLEQVDGVDSLPAKRLTAQRRAYVHGIAPDPGDGFFDAKLVRLAVWVSPYDVDGNNTHAGGPVGQLRDNLDELLEVVGKRTPINIQRIVPTPAGGTLTLEASARVRQGFEVGGSRLLRRIRIDLELPYPFWHELPIVNIAPATGAIPITTSSTSTAPVADMVWTFTAAGRVTHNTSGDWIEIDSIPGGATSVIVDSGARTILDNLGNDARNVFNARRPSLIAFTPDGANNLTATATVGVDFHNARH